MGREPYQAGAARLTAGPWASSRSQDIGWFAEAKALLGKDIRAEIRTRVAVNSVGLFAFASLLLLALATQGLRTILAINILKLPLHTITMGDVSRALIPAWSEQSKMGLLWTLLSFAAFTGLAHSFVHEEEAGTVTALRVCMSAAGVYAGKLGFNLLLLTGIAALVTPFYITLTGMAVGHWFEFTLVMLGGCLGLGSTATIIAALAAKAKGAGALFGAIGMPIITVFLILLLNAANTLYNVDASSMRRIQDIGGLISFGVLLIAVSALTFRFVWEE